jgi:hypothetical protein
MKRSSTTTLEQAFAITAFWDRNGTDLSKVDWWWRERRATG